MKIELWTDGSYRQGACGWGFCAVQENSIVYEACGRVDNSYSSNHANIAGEVVAVVMGVEWALREGYEVISLNVDYTGLINWARGTWKRNNDMTKGYYEWYQDCKELADFRWKHVKGHSGHEFNEKADELAKLGTTMGAIPTLDTEERDKMKGDIFYTKVY